MASKRKSSDPTPEIASKAPRNSLSHSPERTKKGLEHVEIVKTVKAVVIPKIELPQQAFAKSVDSVVIPKLDPLSNSSTTQSESRSQPPQKSALASRHPQHYPVPGSSSSGLPKSAIAARREAKMRQAMQEQDMDDNNDATTSDMDEQEDKDMQDMQIDTIDISEGESDCGAVVTVPEARASTQRPPKGQAKRKKQKKQAPVVDRNAVSVFVPSKQNTAPFTVDGEQYLAVGLQEYESIVFVGKVLVAPVRGAVSILGATLAPGNDADYLEFYPAFSLKSHALLSIAPTRHTSTVFDRKADIRERISKASLTALEPLQAQSFEAVIVFKSLDWCGFDDVDGVFSLAKDLSRVEDYKPHALMDNIPGFQPILQPTSGIRTLDIPSTWSNNVAVAEQDEQERASPLVSIVCGVKDSGKSTFNRYLVNRLLSSHKQVAFLETDVGQTEFTPSGIVSLHIVDSPILGPPYTHQNRASKRSHFFGAATVRDDPGYYLRIVRQLIDTWRQEYNTQLDARQVDQVPLVINSHGWLKGLGYDLLLGIIQAAAPTHVFAIQGTAASFPPTFAADIQPPPNESLQPKLHYIENAPVPRTINKFHAADLRILALISYLHQDMAHFGQAHKRWWNFKTCLVERLPWALDWRTGLDRGIWVLPEDVSLNNLLYALNASIVALVSTDEPSNGAAAAEPETSTDQAPHGQSLITPPKYMPSSEFPPPDPASTRCVGLAVVRAIDVSEHSLLMLTPELPLTLNKVSGLVKGSIDLPAVCMLDGQQGRGTGVARVPWRQVPYVSKDSVEGAGGSAMKIRRINKRA